MSGGSKLPRQWRRRPLFSDLPRRAYLTVKYHGWRELLARLVTAPARLLGQERRARAQLSIWSHHRRVRSWYRRAGRPVTIVMPTYGDPATTIDAVKRLRRTVDGSRSRIVVVDDGSDARHQARLRRIEGAEVELGTSNQGYAASVNRGLARAGADHDVVVLNNDVIGHRHWLEALQYAAYAHDDTGVIGPMLLYPDGRIQAAGAHRNLGAPEWFDHRYRFKRPDHGPANVADLTLAVTGAAMYLRRSLIDEVGDFDDAFPMAYEDIDYCLRAWEAGWQVRYEPSSRLTHVESPTRGTALGEREIRSQEHFWNKWGGWFDDRRVQTDNGRVRAVYVTQDTGVGGGHRDVFEHLNRLHARGHEVELFSLAGPPDWFPLDVPVRTFQNYEALAMALEREDALKVATWWETAPWVWRASVTRGLPVYFVQDIETSYYAGDEAARHRVLASYREEFRYMTISSWNRDRLAELGLSAELIPPGIDLDNFRPDGRPRRDDVVLAIGRSLPLKNLGLTVEAWKRLEPRSELWMFGVEPDLGAEHGIRYFERPSDERVNQLFNEATLFVQTSIHEGFCLPLLEAMAAGTPVVSTDAHGNRDFCRHEENCLIADANPEAVTAALSRLLADPDLRARLTAAGLDTAAEYAWERRIDRLEAFFVALAEKGGAHDLRVALVDREDPRSGGSRQQDLHDHPPPA
jgi:glycosyltransferase involved in cell wall biosynthesis